MGYHFFLGLAELFDKYQIVNSDYRDETCVTFPSITYIKTTEEVYYRVRETYSNPILGLIYLAKPLDTNTVIQLSDLIFENPNILDKKKELGLYKVQAELEEIFLKFSLPDIYNFFELNNFFISKGFVFTKANKESKLAEVHQSQDQNLIEKAEIFVSTLDKLTKGYQALELREDYLKQLETATEANIDLLISQCVLSIGELK